MPELEAPAFPQGPNVTGQETRSSTAVELPANKLTQPPVEVRANAPWVIPIESQTTPSANSPHTSNLAVPATATVNESFEDESIEALEARLKRVKEDRERLAKMNELSRLEADLEREIAAKRQSRV
jgi:hypothetical protein